MDTTDTETDQTDRPEPEAPLTPPGPPVPPGPARQLMRSRQDRMIAGVAGGIGEYFDLDPAIIRIGFVALTVFGGSGLLLYGLGWLLIPEEGSHRSVLGRHTRLGRGPLAFLIVLAVLAIAHPWHAGWRPWSWPLVLVGGGAAVLLASRRRGHHQAAPINVGDTATAALLTSVEPAEPPAPVVPTVTPYLFAGLALLAGIAALIGLTATAALAIGLVLAGGALVAGALRGRIGATPILVALAGTALALSLVAPRGLGDGVGNRTFQPASAGEVQRSYQLGIGHLVVDLSAIQGEAAPIKARLGIGQLVIIVPAGAIVSIHEHAGMGNGSIFGSDQGGLVVDRTAVSGASNGAGNGLVPDFRLDAEVGIGRVEIQRAAA